MEGQNNQNWVSIHKKGEGVLMPQWHKYFPQIIAAVMATSGICSADDNLELPNASTGLTIKGAEGSYNIPGNYYSTEDGIVFLDSSGSELQGGSSQMATFDAYGSEGAKEQKITIKSSQISSIGGKAVVRVEIEAGGRSVSRTIFVPASEIKSKEKVTEEKEETPLLVLEEELIASGAVPTSKITPKDTVKAVETPIFELEEGGDSDLENPQEVGMKSVEEVPLELREEDNRTDKQIVGEYLGDEPFPQVPVMEPGESEYMKEVGNGLLPSLDGSDEDTSGFNPNFDRNVPDAIFGAQEGVEATDDSYNQGPFYKDPVYIKLKKEYGHLPESDLWTMVSEKERALELFDQEVIKYDEWLRGYNVSRSKSSTELDEMNDNTSFEFLTKESERLNSEIPALRKEVIMLRYLAMCTF